LFVNTGPWGTGSFTVIKGLTKELLKLGHVVKILFPDSDLESIDKDEYYKNPDLYDIWKFPIQNKTTQLPTFPLMITDPHPRNPNFLTFKDLTNEQLDLYELELTKKIALLLKTFKPDIIECHHIWCASWVCSKLGVDFSVVAHHSDQMGFRFDRRMQAKALASAKAAKKIITVSESVKREVMRLYHTDESKILVTANGYDKDIFKICKVNRESVLQRLGIDIPTDAPIISFAGKISRTKGIDHLLQANKLLDPAMNIHIIVMGAGDIKAICDKMDPNSYSLKNIHFVGHQIPEHLAEIQNISRVGVMPSRSEGFGISCLEAMGCGVPMIVTRCGGPEQFAIGRIINVGAVKELASSIMAILALSNSEYQKLSNEAVSAAAKFSWKKIAEEHLHVYEKIVSERTSA
ncbi:TPA: glycosyltransferase family 4 protein, partial [Legionella pneumophila]|nr:glycosyltransferase family 4 protein [Legionella pneumophila]